jgi:histidinol-phosphatase (PHP family)
MIDAHVHLERGPYTLEWVWEFVKVAREREIEHLYLLEHSHRFKELRDLYQGIDITDPVFGEYQRDWLERKMTETLADYVRLVESIRRESFPVKVYCGLEVCYFPGREKLIESIASDYHWDFLTGAVHWIDGWGFDHPRTKGAWESRDVDTVYRRYYEIVSELVESGLFTHLAHPDSIKCFGYLPKNDLAEIYAGLAVKAKRHRIKVEFSAGLRINYGCSELGMNPELLACLKKEGVDIITASDAHQPRDVGRYLREAAALIRRNGI